MDLKGIIEAALLASETPVAMERLQLMFAEDMDELPGRDEMLKALAELQDDYAGRAIELKEVASGWRFQIRREYAPWVNRLWEDRTARYSRALLETLAIVAYRQPVTRGEIEEIRGVSISQSIIRTITEREWVRIAGHKDVPGRPAVYVTTRQFLDYFNLKSLDELPPLKDFLETPVEEVAQDAGLTPQVLAGDGETVQVSNEPAALGSVTESVETRPALRLVGGLEFKENATETEPVEEQAKETDEQKTDREEGAG
jgi:segregation and condensation protein B